MNKEIMKKQTDIRHIWSVLCQKTSIDIDSNSLTISDVLEQIRIDHKQLDEVKKQSKGKTITVPIHVELITLWDRQDSAERKIEGRIKIIDSKGEILMEKTYPMIFKKDKKRLRFRVLMNGIPLTVAGEYIFTVEIKKENQKGFEEMTRIPLDIAIADLSVKKTN